MFNWERWLENKEECKKEFEKYLAKKMIKIEDETEDLSISHIKKVDHNLDFVGDLMGGEKFYDWVIVGCYYSIYHATLALLSMKGYSSKNHTATLCSLINLYYKEGLEKEDIELEFKQLDCGDYILSDRVALEYKKGEDLLSSIIDGRLFEQLGSLTNAYQIPILLIEGFPSGGIHPEAIAGALSSFMIDFGVSIIQTQNSEESAAIIRRIALREQKTKKRKPLIRKSMKMGNPNESAIQVISSYPGINRTLATRLLENHGSISNIVNAKEDELKKIEGLGVKKSRKIVDLSNKEYD